MIKKYLGIELKQSNPCASSFKRKSKSNENLDLYKSPTLIGLNNIETHYIMNPTFTMLMSNKRIN